MFRSRIARLASLATTALLATMLLGVGGATAKTPGWSLTADAANLPTSLPDTVSPGAYAGYHFKLTNTGSSNIAQLYLTAAFPAAYFDPSRACEASLNSPNFYCSFGALNAGDSITVTIAFATPSSGSSFDPVLQFNGTGSTTSDTGHHSHGDTLDVLVSTTLSGSSDFAGGFSLVDGTTFSTSTGLTKRNPQSSTITGPNLLGITVTEGSTFPSTGTDPCSANGVTCIGQWDKLSVGNHQEGPVKLVLTILGSTVKGNPSLSDINLWHEGDGVITARCSSDAPPTSEMPCIIVTKVGNNYQIVAWLLHNGGARGLF